LLQHDAVRQRRLCRWHAKSIEAQLTLRAGDCRRLLQLVDGLAGVAPVFPLVSLVLAIAQGALGGGFVTTVARTLWAEVAGWRQRRLLGIGSRAR